MFRRPTALMGFARKEIAYLCRTAGSALDFIIIIYTLGGRWNIDGKHGDKEGKRCNKISATFDVDG